MDARYKDRANAVGRLVERLYVKRGDDMSDFERAITFILKWEGGYVNDPKDPGGETKFGICKRAHPTLDIKELTEEGARAIYAADYWAKAGCDKLEWPMCLVVFDTACNMGVKRALDFKAAAPQDWMAYLRTRGIFYMKNGDFYYLKGWINRLVDLYKTAKGI